MHIGLIGGLGRAAAVVYDQRLCAAMAGTGLNLAFDGAALPHRVIDALDVHVAVLADLASGRASRDALGSRA